MSSPEAFDVVCVGQATQDIVFAIDHHPGIDEKMTASGHLQCGGGPAANAAVTVARLGLRAAYIGYLGQDDFGEALLEELLGAGVDTRHVQRGEAPTAVSTILVHPNASRTVVNFRDPTAHLLPALLHFDVGCTRVLLFDGHEPIISPALAGAAQDQGVQTILDAGSLHAGTKALAAAVDTLVASEKFARQWSGLTLRSEWLRVLAAAAPEVVITRGDRGLIWSRNGEEGEMPAFQVQAIDSTGAGDVFHGAFAAGVSQGWPWLKNLEFSSAAAALACEKLGGRPAIPTFDQVTHFLHTKNDGTRQLSHNPS